MENALLEQNENGQAAVSCSTSNPQDKAVMANTKKKIIHQSTILAVGAVGIFASYSGVSSLQSTLNFEESIGTTSLALCFAATILTSATIASIVLNRAGAKSMIDFSEVTFVQFSLANVYPEKSSETSLPARRQNVEKKIRWFSGRFYSIFSAYLVIGNVMAYGILKLDQTGNTVHASNNHTNVTSNET